MSARRFSFRTLVVLVTMLTALTAIVTSAGATPSDPAKPSVTAATTTDQQRAAQAQRLARTEGGTVHYAVNRRPSCATPTKPAYATCNVIQRKNVAKGIDGAYPYVQPADVPMAPAGGYTPADLATAYGYDPTLDRSTTTIGIVDWYNDPNAASDLNAFDRHYGLPIETTSTFLRVNQRGVHGSYPKNDRGTAPEIALDIESARSACNKCKIVLIEADNPSGPSLAASVNQLVKMGVKIISNSYGIPEAAEAQTKSTVAAYNHPGVVITASTADQGWYGWTYFNNTSGEDRSPSSASFPSSDPNVIAVGGTNLVLNDDGTRKTETVWNDNGRVNGQTDPTTAGLTGATGGGCSQVFKAKPWQTNEPGYAAAGCKGMRLAADVSAIGDPATGFGIYDTYGVINGERDHGWTVVGGTSLAAPLTAGIYALAGGSAGSAYPVTSAYVNSSINSDSLFDVTPLSDDAATGRASGNSFCGGADAADCGTQLYAHTTPATHNPNDLGDHHGHYAGLLDCSFPYKNVDATASGRKSECNTVTGYDGPTGLGTPVSPAIYKPTVFKLEYAAPRTAKVGQLVSFSPQTIARVAGTKIDHYAWNFGDGTKTAYITYASTHHTFRKKGTYVVALSVTDKLHQVVIKRVPIKVS